MDNQSLYDKLKSSYNEANLNNITLKIVELYRNKKYETILKLGKKIKDSIEFDISKPGRVFNQLILLYHPDKLNYYKKALEKLITNDEKEKINVFTHIFEIQEALNNQPVPDNFDYSDLYNSQVEFSIDDEDFDSMVHPDLSYDDWQDNPDDSFNDFLSAIQRKENISFNINSVDFFLEQLDGELDLSNSNIVGLDGLEHCKNISLLDLSENQIIDISNIQGLIFLEAIYLSNNNISDILPLADLKNLKYIDLSFNDILDIEPLLEINELKYLNVVGNRISYEQINNFRKNGIVIVI